MKKIINGYFIGTLITLLLVGGVAYATANTKTIDVIYDNIKIFKDNVLCELKDANGTVIEPFIYNGTTYMPVRGTANLANMQVTWDGETKSVYLWDEQVPSGTNLMEVCPPYELRSFRSYSSAEGKSFKMGGTRYSDGIVSPDSWDTDRVALFNIDSKFSSLECVIGHVTNEEYAKSISFIVDGKIVDTIRIEPDSMPKKVRIPLKYGLQLKIMVNELDDGKMSGVGIGNITIQ